jgi:hypothetical protein
MTADIINLRRHRKRIERETQAAKAAENRALHGRSKTAMSLDKARRELDLKHLAGHKRDQEGDEP